MGQAPWWDAKRTPSPSVKFMSYDKMKPGILIVKNYKIIISFWKTVRKNKCEI